MGTEVYDPYSTNAMFSRILQRLDQQDTDSKLFREELNTKFTSFKTKLNDTDGRVDSLENAQWRQRGFVAAVALIIPALWQWATNPK